MTSLSLVEELQKLGAGDLDAMADFAGVLSGAQPTTPTAGKGVDEAVAALFAEANADIQDEELVTDYGTDRAKFESELKAAIKEAVEREVGKGVSLDEAFKIIRSGLAGKKSKIRVLRGAEKLAGKRTRMRTRGKRRLQGVRYRRSAGGKKVARHAKSRRKKFGESTVADEMRGLLTESGHAAAGLSSGHEDVLEAYDRIDRIGSLLGDFFEDFGNEKDADIAKVMDEMIAAIDARSDLIMEGKVSDPAAEFPRIQSYVKVLGRALEKYNEYDLKTLEAPAAGN